MKFSKKARLRRAKFSKINKRAARIRTGGRKSVEKLICGAAPCIWHKGVS